MNVIVTDGTEGGHPGLLKNIYPAFEDCKLGEDLRSPGQLADEIKIKRAQFHFMKIVSENFRAQAFGGEGTFESGKFIP